MMNRSFDRRLESLFLLIDENLMRQVITILHYNLADNVNSYDMTEDGSYVKYQIHEGEDEINIHRMFYQFKEDELIKGCLF
jgi:polyphosphate kinase